MARHAIVTAVVTLAFALLVYSTIYLRIGLAPLSDIRILSTDNRAITLVILVFPPITKSVAPELIAVTFHHPYRVRHFPLDAGEYGFAIIRWTLNAIAILIVSSALFIGVVISSIGLIQG
jgi:hypothetical protein